MSHRITSSQNQRVKNAGRLRTRRGRQRQGRIIIDGLREIHRALIAGVELVELFVCEPMCVDELSQEVLTLADQNEAQRFNVASAVLERMAFGKRCEGIVAVAVPPNNTLDSLLLDDNPLLAIIENVEKPGNLGAVMRSADGAGLSAVIAADAHTDLFNPNAIRASLGAIFTLPVCETSSQQAKSWLAQRGIAIVAASVDAECDYDAVDFKRPTAIVLGSEADGLSDVWRGDDVQAVRLPMLGVCDSLNVSAAASVLFYEARRQRGSVCPSG